MTNFIRVDDYILYAMYVMLFFGLVGSMNRNVDEATNELVSRQLEAFILLLFGRVMSANSHGDSMDKHMICRDGMIDDADQRCRSSALAL